VITGSRIAGELTSTVDPVVSSKDIQTSGKTDINDIILQCAELRTVWQDLGPHQRLKAAVWYGTCAAGPNRTLVLVDGIRGSAWVRVTFQSPAPDLDQIRPSSDVVEVVGGRLGDLRVDAIEASVQDDVLMWSCAG